MCQAYPIMGTGMSQDVFNLLGVIDQEGIRESNPDLYIHHPDHYATATGTNTS